MVANIERKAVMAEQRLENKLMEFHSHYRTLTTILNFFTTQLINDDSDEITRAQIDTMMENISKQTEGKLELLNEIIDEFQETYCKPKAELV